MGKLTAGYVQRLKSTDKNRRYSDGDGLSLVVRPNGSKAWQLRIKKTDHGLGSYPTVKLAEARRKATDMRSAAAAGRSVDEVVAAVPSFQTVAEMYLKANAPTWRHHKTEGDTRTRLESYAYPSFGTTPVDRIRRRDVMDVLTPIWTDKPAVGRKLKQAMNRVFIHALARDWVTVNPVDEAVGQALPKTPATREHFRSMPYPAVPAAMLTVAGGPSSDAVRLCFRWLVLTASRSGEARNARWQDIDLKNRTWTIPGSMMKSGREHRVPLSTQAAQVLTDAGPLMDGSGLVFPGANGALSDMTLTKLLRGNGLAETATVHGFRTSFKTWCMETTDTPWAVGEAALAHALGNSTEQAYARTDLFDRRRDLMQLWADYTNETGGE
jgi:integrase